MVNKDILNKVLSLVIIILLAIIIAPYLVARTSTAQQTDMPPGMVMKTFELGSTPSASMAGMNGMTANMAMGQPATSASTTPTPTVAIDLKKDSLDGWDLHVETTNFTWTPENINQGPVADQGHAHLYIDGQLFVLLAPWYHIDSALLSPGKHVITVSLNANDHSVFAVNGKNIQATQTLLVSPL